MACSGSGLPASAGTRMFRPHITGSLSRRGRARTKNRLENVGDGGDGGEMAGREKQDEGERKETRVKQDRGRFHGLLTGRKKFQARRCWPCPPLPDEL